MRFGFTHIPGLLASEGAVFSTVVYGYLVDSSLIDPLTAHQEVIAVWKREISMCDFLKGLTDLDADHLADL